jgi:hypothetical protein
MENVLTSRGSPCSTTCRDQRKKTQLTLTAAFMNIFIKLPGQNALATQEERIMKA